jgi:phosphoglucosamine mutase
MRKIFGTDGIRGVVGKYPITPDFALRFGYAVGKILGKYGKETSVIIGKDTRLSGYLFESSLSAGFNYAGVNVYMAGPIPTPAIAYLTHTLHLSAGVVISASHNSFNDNGIKIFSNKGTKLADEIELAIEEELNNEMVMAENIGKVRRIEDASGRYIEFCKNTFPKELTLNGIKIVLDCANGAAYKVAPSVFKELGAQVVTYACQPDGKNINYECGSTHPTGLIATVLNEKADYGIAFDGDGDRVIFVDSNGKIYNGDKLIYAILINQLQQKIALSGIVGTVMTNMAMEKALQKLQIKLCRAKVGDRYVLDELSKNKWNLGGEASGHILCLDKHSTGDGIISSLQVMAAIIQLNKNLVDIVDWEDYPQTMINVRLNAKHAKWNELTKDIIAEAGANLGDNGRIIVRPSGTEPVVRVMVEAKNKKDSELWANKIAQVLVS